MLTLATAYRMLFGHGRTPASPATTCWSGAPRAASARSACSYPAAGRQCDRHHLRRDQARFRACQLGAKGVINRNNFDCWGQLPEVGRPGLCRLHEGGRKFGKAIWDITGKGNDVDFVFEHPGEQTFPVSCFVVKRGGMVVFCAGTTGYNITFDARYRVDAPEAHPGQPLRQSAAGEPGQRAGLERRIDPCMSEVFPWAEIPRAHTKMWKNQHKPGNMAVLVNRAASGPAQLREGHGGGGRRGA